MTRLIAFRSPVRFDHALIAFIVISGWRLPAIADDLNPPGYRGLPRSTSAEWDFLTDQPTNNIQPDGTSVPLVVGDTQPQLDAAFTGDPHPSGNRFGGPSVAWTGAISNGGYQATGPSSVDRGLVFNVPNWIDEEPLKRLRIQVTYQGPAPTTDVIGALGIPGSSDNVVEQFVTRVTDTSPSLPAGMSYFYDDWTCRPNPDWEQVVIYMSDGTFVDQVVIDSVSFVPEPSFLAMVVSGLAGLALRRLDPERIRAGSK
jgi:hypothetical protein